MIERVICYVDPKCGSSTQTSFVGGKEWMRVPWEFVDKSLEDFKREVIEYAGITGEAEKRGLGQSIKVKVCHFDKTEGTKVFSLNNQTQWEADLDLCANWLIG